MKTMKAKPARHKQPLPAGARARKRTARKPSFHAPIIVTEQNVEDLKRKFDSLSEDDPEYERLGDALHRYMID